MSSPIKLADSPWRGVAAMELTHRVITMLDRQEMDFLDKLGKDALFSTGHKLSYNEILKGLIDFAMESGVSGDNIESFAALKEKMLERIRKAGV